MNEPVIHLIEILNLKHSKRWINFVEIFKAMGSVEKLNSVLVIMRRDNIILICSAQSIRNS